jgi:hypothetical protein
MANSYSVLLKFLENSNSYSIFEFEGKIKFIVVTYSLVVYLAVISKSLSGAPLYGWLIKIGCFLKKEKYSFSLKSS